MNHVFKSSFLTVYLNQGAASWSPPPWEPDECPNSEFSGSYSYDSNRGRSWGSETRRKYYKSDSENDIDFYEEQGDTGSRQQSRQVNRYRKGAADHNDPMGSLDGMQQRFTKENALINSLHKY